MRYNPPHIIAEVGCNHKGDMEIAYEFIEIAATFCKVDTVKFQKRCAKELLSTESYNTPHPIPHNAYGPTYGEHREFLEFTAEQHSQLKARCEEMGLVYSSSVWDMTSAREIAALNPQYIKIPSACNNYYAMLEWLCDNYSGELHVSLGMTTQEEERKIIDLFVQKKRNRDLTIYACSSDYPISCENACLLEISRLIECYGDIIKQIGFSGHHNGIAIDIAAYALGAVVFERHFTLNRTWKGTDHAASLEPDGLRRLKRDLICTHKALTYKSKEILPVEEVQRNKLKYKPCD
jgi:N-acetylneuraminate synthase